MYGASARALLRLWPRLIVAYALVTLLVYYGWPQIALLITHAATSLIIASSPFPHIGQLGWTETGFLVSDGILGKAFYLQTPSLQLMFGFPIGLALALPGQLTASYWLRVFWTLVASVAACSVLLAIMTDWYLVSNLSLTGIEIHASWHNELLRQLGHRFWDLAILYPFLACLVLGRAALNEVAAGLASAPLDEGRAETRDEGVAESAVETTDEGVAEGRPQRPWFQRGNLAVLASLLLVGAIELRAQGSLSRPPEELAAALLERNPAIGTSYLRHAKTMENSGNEDAARRWYREASKHSVSQKQATRELRRLRARRNAKQDDGREKPNSR